MRRWAEVISLLGIQMAENWKEIEDKGQIALDIFDLLIQANALAAAHPSRVRHFHLLNTHFLALLQCIDQLFQGYFCIGTFPSPDFIVKPHAKTSFAMDGNYNNGNNDHIFMTLLCLAILSRLH